MNRLRCVRNFYGMTIREVANYLYCDYSLYSKFERGEREIPLSYLITLSQLYETNIEYLVALTDYAKPLPKARCSISYETVYKK